MRTSGNTWAAIGAVSVLFLALGVGTGASAGDPVVAKARTYLKSLKRSTRAPCRVAGRRGT